MAQSVEHVIGNDEVISSILITSSKVLGNIRGLFVLVYALIRDIERVTKGFVGRARHSVITSVMIRNRRRLLPRRPTSRGRSSILIPSPNPSDNSEGFLFYKYESPQGLDQIVLTQKRADKGWFL